MGRREKSNVHENESFMEQCTEVSRSDRIRNEIIR